MADSKADLRQARRARGRKAKKRVLIASYWQNEETMQAILAAAAELDWDLTDLRFLHNEDPMAFKPDGILCCKWDIPDTLPPLLQAKVPVVHTWSIMPHRPQTEYPTVTSDTRFVGAMAAKHLLERGFKQVCFLAFVGDYNEQHPLVSSFRESLECGGARFAGLHHIDIDGPEWQLAFAQSLHAWFKTMPRPLGVVTSGDVLGGHLTGFCKSFGIAVPEEIAVLGIGNKLRWCDMSPCPLSSVDLNPVARGKAAVALLNRLINGEEPPAEPVLIPPSGVVTRKSTDIMASADVAVAKALAFLWEHLGEQISVDTAAAAAGLSRSSLERRFRRETGRSVNEELLRKRLERCRELLLTTKLSFVDIAPQVGFLSKTYLHRIFREHYHCTPKEMRMTEVGSSKKAPKNGCKLSDG